MKAQDKTLSTPVQYTGGSGEEASFYPYIETYIGKLKGFNDASVSIESGGQLYRGIYAQADVYIVDTDRQMVSAALMEDVLARKYDTDSNSQVFFRLNRKQITDVVIYR